MKSNLSRIFYIYSEASMAVLFTIGGLVELICGIAVCLYEPSLGLLNFFSVFTGTAALAFFLVAALNVLYIIKQENK